MRFENTWHRIVRWREAQPQETRVWLCWILDAFMRGFSLVAKLEVLVSPARLRTIITENKHFPSQGAGFLAANGRARTLRCGRLSPIRWLTGMNFSNSKPPSDVPHCAPTTSAHVDPQWNLDGGLGYSNNPRTLHTPTSIRDSNGVPTPSSRGQSSPRTRTWARHSVGTA